MDFKPIENNGEFLHGGNVYAKLRETDGTLGDILDFSANINPLGLSENVRQAILKAVDNVIHYPDPDNRELKEALSSYYGVDTEHITTGNGAAELIYVLSNIVKPRRVLLPAPTFSEYRRASLAAGAQIRHFFLRAEDGFTLKTDRLAKEMGPGEITYLCNPNNPTGTLLKTAEIIPILAQAAKQNGLVVVDESFLDFLEDNDKYTCRPLLTEYPNLVIIHSLTKFFALPGLRLGFALSSPALAKAMHLAKDVWNVNTLAQRAGVAALTDGVYQARARQLVKQAKEELYQKLQDLPGFYPYAPSVNYILINIGGSGFSAPRLCELLAEKNILIRDCGNYPGLSPDYIRVAVKLPEQNGVLLAALYGVIGGKET